MALRRRRLVKHRRQEALGRKARNRPRLLRKVFDQARSWVADIGGNHLQELLDALEDARAP